jgi:hypothetical protein
MGTLTMKTIKFFLIFLFLAVNLHSQNWNNIVNTQLSLQTATSADAFTNIHGINLIYHGYDGRTGIYYVLLSTNGTVLKQRQIDNDGFSPIIVGDNDNLFAVYVKNNSLKVLRSTNLFTNWTDISPSNANNIAVSIPDANRDENGDTESGQYQMFDAAFRDERLHVAWTEDLFNFPEAYYSQYFLETNSWIFNREEITSDYIGETGGRPRIAILPTINKLVFSYNWFSLGGDLYGNVRTRYRDIDAAGWSTAITPFSGNSIGEEISSDNTYIHLFYYEFMQVGQPRLLHHKKMIIGGTSWPGSSTQLSSDLDTWNGVKCSKTNNGVFHINYIQYERTTPVNKHLHHRSFSNNNWSGTFTVSGMLGKTEFAGFSSVSNDLYVGWFNYESNSSKLYYRQYDAAPLAPTGLTLSQSINNHPLLQWTKNNEPDVTVYKVYRNPGSGWQYIG